MTQTTIGSIQADVPRMLAGEVIQSGQYCKTWISEGKVIGDIVYKGESLGPVELGQVVEGKFVPKC